MRDVLGDRRATAILLGPALLLYSAIILVPIFWSMGYTLFQGNAVLGFQYAGLANFRELAHDPAVWRAAWFTVRYAVVLTVGQVALGYLMSLLYVFLLRRASGFVRTMVFFPVVLPTVAVALMFQKLFESAPTTGPVNALLNAIGLHSVDWFGRPGTAFWLVVLMDIWRSIGFYAVLLYAGLVDIPEDVIESARIDGAVRWRLIRHVILPLSAPVLFSSVIFSINGTLKVFDSVLALTNGGPGDATTPLTLYMYRTAFSYGDYGYGSTVALLLTVMCLAFTIVIFRATRRDRTKG